MHSSLKAAVVNSHSETPFDGYIDVFEGQMDLDDQQHGLDDGNHGQDGLSSDRTVAKQNELMAEALLYGQELRQEFKDSFRPETRKELEETFALIAYPDARDSVLAPLLEVSGRISVAEELSSAILGMTFHVLFICFGSLLTLFCPVSLGKSSAAAIERLTQQAETLIADLSREGGPASFIHVRNDYVR